MKRIVLTGLTLFTLAPCVVAQQKWTATEAGTYRLVKNPGGQTLGYTPESGVKPLTVNGIAFKDLNRNGSLDPYEDWRLPADQRAKDLAGKLTVEEIAGLMLYSSHQSILARAGGRVFCGDTQRTTLQRGPSRPHRPDRSAAEIPERR